jgi:polyisoprenoid-binding protein YceI
MPVYRVNPSRSQVWMRAESSIHPIHGEARGLEGEIVAEVADGRLDLDVAPKIRIELPIEQLESGNALQDTEMRRRVDARRYPTIIGESTDVTHQRGDRYLVRGDLTFHGVTRTVEGEVDVDIPDERTMVFEGESVFDVREYKVAPPKILMFRVHPQVTVRVRVVGELRE